MAILVAGVPTPVSPQPPPSSCPRDCTPNILVEPHVWLLAWARVNTVSHDAPRAADTGEHFEARQSPVTLDTILR